MRKSWKRTPKKRRRSFTRSETRSTPKKNYAEARRYFSYARETNPDEPAYWRDEAAAAIKAVIWKVEIRFSARPAGRELTVTISPTWRRRLPQAAGDWESVAGYAGQLTALPGELGVRACLLQEEILRQMERPRSGQSF